MTSYVQTYEFTAFAEADLLQAGDHNINCGDTFTMPANATVCISVTDNDGYLSGDSCHNENANDRYGQQASITDALTGAELGNGGQIYGESYFWVYDQNGKWYMMVEIEQEGTGDDYFAFHNYYGVPPEGSVLTVHSQSNITDWEPDYKCLTAGPKLETGSIKGRVFEDADCDNTEWNSETGTWEDGIENVTVELLDAHGNVIATDETDANGWYKFDDLPPNEEYVVRFVKPEGLDFVKEDVGHGGKDSDANVETGESFTIHLSSGENVKNVDAGLKPNTGSIEGRVFCDLDCDGIEDKGITTITKGENLLSDSTFENGNHTVYNVGQFGAWYDAGNDSGDIITGTDARHYGNPHGNEIFELDRGSILCQEFDVVEGGKYCLTFDVYDNAFLEKWDDKFIVKINGHEVETVMVTRDDHIEIVLDLDPGQNRIDFVSLSHVSGKGPGIDNIEIRQEIVTTAEGEPGKEGVTVNLIDATGAVIATTTTDADGNYKFADVPEGDYTVEVVAPAGQEFTFQDVGGDDTMDSDVDANGQVTVTVKGGEVTGDVDAGLKEIKPGSLSGRYFCDDDGDGLDNDGSDNGVGGITVELLDAAGNGTGITTTTASDGSYSFAGLAPGSYGVRFTDPANVNDGKALTTPNVDGDASDDIDSDAIGDAGTSQILGIEVVSEQDTPNNDAGVVPLGSISGRLFCDTDNDDLDNGNGGEPGVGGVTVTLTNVTTGDELTTETGPDGSYSFDDLAAGDYKVTFDGADADLAGKIFVNQTPGDNDAIGGSDVDPANGMTEVFTLGVGEDKTDVDAGVEELGSLSGRYFCDDDGDGLDNDGPDNGVEGITVELLDAAGNGTGITTTTASDGSYSFSGLAPGSYGVRFTDPANVNDGKVLTAPNVDGDVSDDIDSDAIGDAGTSQILGIEVVGGQDTPDNDAGVLPLGSISGRYFCDENDNDVDDSEPGVNGLTVTLVDVDSGQVVATQETSTIDGVDGSYSFGDLAAGNYQVVFPADPTGKTFVAPNDPNGNGDDTNDSDAVPNTDGTASSPVIPLGVGENVADVDAGVENADPGTGAIGDTIWLDLFGDGLFNDFEATIDGVTVQLKDAGGEVIAEQVTSNGGQYLFENLDAGTYFVQIVTPVIGDTVTFVNADGTTETITLEAGDIEGFELTTPNAGDDALDSDFDPSTAMTGAIELEAGEIDLTNDGGLLRCGLIVGTSQIVGPNNPIAPAGGYDLLVGCETNDTILGESGEDTLIGNGGDDFIDGSSFDDTLDGGAGNDDLNGGSENDILTGGLGDDDLDGGSEFDIAVFSGNAADSTIDIVDIFTGSLVVTGADGTDTVRNVEVLRFDDGDVLVDEIVPGGSADVVAAPGAPGGSVNIDVLANDIGVGEGTLEVVEANNGGFGSVVIEADGTVTYTAGAGFAGYDFFSYTVSNGLGFLRTVEVQVGDLPQLNAGDPGVVALADFIGDDGDVFVGTNAAESVLGGIGYDSISAANGNDVIDGGKGNDNIRGGGANDVLIGGEGDDRLNAEGGNDQTFGGLGDDVVVGGQTDDMIFGGDGNDQMRGQDGSDFISGGAGDDTFTQFRSGADIALGGSGDDSFQWAESDGAERDFIDGESGIDELRITLDGTADAVAVQAEIDAYLAQAATNTPSGGTISDGSVLSDTFSFTTIELDIRNIEDVFIA